MQTAAFACSCSPGSMGTNIGIEYVACGTNTADNEVVTYTVHNNILCSGSNFYKPGYYYSYTQNGTPGGTANWLAGNGAYRVFKTGSHILAIHKNFRGEICGVRVTDYPFGVVHNDVITCCPHIFPPSGEEGNDRDADGVVDCIDNCPDDPNPDQGPCPDPLDSADTKDKEFGTDINDCKINRNQNLVADPINIFNGNFIENEMDLAFSSPFEGDLVFKRYYNSQSTIDSTIGFGWTHNFNLKIFPDFNDSTKLIKIMDQTGRGYYFEDYDQDGIFKGAFSENSTIAQDTENNYLWVKDDGFIYKFEYITGRLLSIKDKSGNVQTLSYTAGNLLETVTDEASGRTLTFYYTASDKIDYILGPVTLAVPDGIWITYTYDSSNNLTGVYYADDENGSPSSGFEYLYEDTNDTNNLTAKKDLAGHVISTWVYNENDQAIENVNNQGTGATINYDNPNEVAVNDAYGITSVYHIAQIAGRKKITHTTKPSGCTSCSDGIYETEFDESTGFPTQREYFNGRIDSYQDYDENNNPQTMVVAQGSDDEKTVFKTYHTDLSTPLTITEKSLFADISNPDREKVTIYDYDDPSDVSDTDIPNENSTFLIYRTIEKGFTMDNTATIVSYEYISRYSYNSQGQITQIDGPLPGISDTIDFVYDVVTKDLLTITHPVTGSVALEYDAAGNIIKSIDQNNIEIIFTHDGRNRQLSAQTVGKTYAQSFTAAGKRSSVTDRSGQNTNYTYNSQGLLEKIINSNGEYLSFDYDANANKIEESIYSSQGTQTFFKGYDFGEPAANTDLAPGKPWKSISRNQDNTDNLETTYQYEHGNLTQIATPDGLKTILEYDTLNRITQSTKIKSDLDQEITTYTYDCHDNLIKIKDTQDHEITYMYDDLNRLVKTISPDTGTTQYSYDESGNLITKNQNTPMVNYAYDTLGRLTEIDYTGDTSSNVTLTYDQGLYGKGKLTGIIDPSGSYTYSYNIYGHLVTELKTISGISYTTAYTYDDAGRPTSITYPSGRIVLYTLDNSGSIETVSTSESQTFQILADNIDYQPFGPVKSLKYGNSKTGNIESDLSYLTKSLTLTLSTAIDLSYTRDPSGNIQIISDNFNPVETFSYDDLYRLTDASGPYGENVYTYDKTGNRQTKITDHVNETYRYTFGTNQLEQVAGSATKTYTYNINGSIKSIDSRQYFYNLHERLIKVTDGTSTLGEYGYNYYDQRTHKTVNTITTLFHYDTSGNLIAETGQDGTPLKEYVYLENNPLAMFVYGPEGYDPADIDFDGDVDGKDLTTANGSNLSSLAAGFGKLYNPGTKTYYYHNNHLGTPIILTNDNGQIVWQADYTPFGSVNILTDTVENNLRFPGQYYDQETGLHYNYHRYYDPDTGRYLTPDPIGLAGGINLFVYAENNPINMIDPFGLYDMYSSYSQFHGYNINHHPKLNITAAQQKSAFEIVKFLTDQAAQITAEQLTIRYINPIAGTFLKKVNFFIGIFDPFPPPAEAPTLPTNKDILLCK